MRTLLRQTFTLSWLSNVTLIALGVGVYAAGESWLHHLRHRDEHLVWDHGEDFVRAWQGGGPQALEREIGRVVGEEPIRIWLYQRSDLPVAGEPPPDPGPALVMPAMLSRLRMLKPSRHAQGMWHAFPLTPPFVVLAWVPEHPQWYAFFNPVAVFVQVLGALVTAALVSYALARSIAHPLTRLREATHRVASGDLSTRIRPSLAWRYEEIDALATDFDEMTTRVEQLLESKRRLVRDVSHELRSPLTRLSVALELLRAEAGSGSERALRRIEREAERLNALIQEMLTLSRLESGLDGVARVTFELGALVAQVSADADFEASSRGRRVTVVTTPPLWVVGVPELVRSAVENVLRNALRYTPEGTEVTVELSEAEGRATVRVRDHGPGVPEGAMGRLFEPFFRGPVVSGASHGGVGLGLAITRRALWVNGGDVVAHNHPQGGLEVEMTLPTVSQPALEAP